jgi:DNA-binding response OmpR family regulator
VLVVEDDNAVRSPLEVALRNEDYVVEACADGRGIEAVAAQFKPDLAVLDVRLPVGPDGYAMARILRGLGDQPILFLTAADAENERLSGFEAGADDYLVKPFSMAELLARVKALLRRSGRLSSAVLQFGDLLIDEGARSVVRNGQVVELTRTEYELLLALARHPGQVLSKVQLLTQVWGFDAYDANLVEVHVSALRRKLESTGARLVHTVRGMGYSLRA